MLLVSATDITGLAKRYDKQQPARTGQVLTLRPLSLDAKDQADSAAAFHRQRKSAARFVDHRGL